MPEPEWNPAPLITVPRELLSPTVALFPAYTKADADLPAWLHPAPKHEGSVLWLKLKIAF